MFKSPKGWAWAAERPGDSPREEGKGRGVRVPEVEDDLMGVDGGDSKPGTSTFSSRPAVSTPNVAVGPALPGALAGRGTSSKGTRSSLSESSTSP